jgi:hypothetical protein
MISRKKECKATVVDRLGEHTSYAIVSTSALKSIEKFAHNDVMQLVHEHEQPSTMGINLQTSLLCY